MWREHTEFEAIKESSVCLITKIYGGESRSGWHMRANLTLTLSPCLDAIDVQDEVFVSAYSS